MAEKGVIVYSGGMDSFTLLHALLRGDESVHKEKWNLRALSLNYGQRHARELGQARRVCSTLGVPQKVVDLRSINQLLQGSALTSPGVVLPQGRYQEDSMKVTVVPNRNMILLSLAVGYAISIGASTAFIGAHAGDHALYPDCRPEFITALAQAARLAYYTPVDVRAPFRHRQKKQILEAGLRMGLDYSFPTSFSSRVSEPYRRPQRTIFWFQNDSII